MGKLKNVVIDLMNKRLNCKPNIDCECRVGPRCKYFEWEGMNNPECKDPYKNTEPVR